MVNDLSGGQQQRVALARALIMRPPVLLLDEPLAALDLKLRQAMQDELRRIHSEIGGTFVFVTHDQSEAMSLANRLGVMHEGEMVQVSAPADIYANPRTPFVAAFVGDANLLEGERLDGWVVLAAGPRFPGHGPNGRVVAVVRPEAMSIGPAPAGHHAVQGQIADVIFMGPHVRYAVEVSPTIRIVVEARPGRGSPMARGDRVIAYWSPGDSTLLDRA